MRLLTYDSEGELCISVEPKDGPQPYAILSHTWGADEEEVTYLDVRHGLGRNKAGYCKIEFCGREAKRDRLEHFWVDTCCINKADHYEVPEAITSMFRWYKEAQICYVYLSDVSVQEQQQDCKYPSWHESFRSSRWFTRGWTLQELLAPQHVVFFSQEMERLGTKAELKHLIHEITSIPVAALQSLDLSQFSVTERLRWAQGRGTKKKEDATYCLLGIFGVSIPPQYGEGNEKAFRRLIKEIDDNLGTSICRVMSLLHTSAYEDALAAIESPLKDTCTWILQHENYKRWHERDKNTLLWYTGPAGYGKSTMAKFLVENIRTDPTTLVAYVSFVSGATVAKHNLRAAQAILHQLCQSNDELANYVWNQAARSGENILGEVAALWRIISESFTLLENRKVVLVFDNIDSCDICELQRLMRHLKNLLSCQYHSKVVVKLAVFGCPYHAIQYQCLCRTRFASCYHIAIEDSHSMEHGFVQRDMKRYLWGRFKQVVDSHHLSRNTTAPLAAKLRYVKNPDFLWSRIVMDSVMALAGSTTYELITLIDSIPPTVEAAYEHMLRRCRDHNEARIIFSIVIAAERPILLSEMDIFLALNRSMHSPEAFELLGEHRLSLRLQEICGLALTFSDSKIAFAYPRLNDYLQCVSPKERIHLNDSDADQQRDWKSSIDINEAHHLLGRLCVQKLLMNEAHLSEGGWSTCRSDTRPGSWYPHDYTEQYWASHIAIALQHANLETCSTSIKDLVVWGLDLARADAAGKSLLHHTVNTRDCTINHNLAQVIVHCHGLVTYADHENFTCLHYAVLRGDAQMVDTLLNAGFDINTAVRRSWQGQQGQNRQMKLTETVRNDRSESSSAGLSALHAAVYFGRFEMVTVLLDRGANITLCNEYGQTALHLAVSKRIEGSRCSDGWEADFNMPELLYSEYFDEDPVWTLHRLKEVERDRLAIVEALGRKSPSSVYMRDWRGRTALHQCEFSQHRSAVPYVDMLLELGSDIHGTDREGLTPLHLAARAGDNESVQAMAQTPRDLMVADSHGRNTLHHAASSGAEDLVAFILDFAKCHEIELSTDVDGRHAIHYCFYNGSHEFVTVPQHNVLQTLTQHQVLCSHTDNFGQDALALYLTRHGLSAQTEILDLLAGKCNVYYKDHKGMYLIHHLAYFLSDLDAAAVTILYKHSAPITVLDQDSKSMVHHAAIAGTVSVELLDFFEKHMRLDLHQPDRSGRTALSYAKDLAKKNKTDKKRWMLFRSDRWKTTIAAFQHYGEKTFSAFVHVS